MNNMTKIWIEVYRCEICKKPIFGPMIGYGNGDGDLFVHPHCYRANEKVVTWYNNLIDKIRPGDWKSAIKR